VPPLLRDDHPLALTLDRPRESGACCFAPEATFPTRTRGLSLLTPQALTTLSARLRPEPGYSHFDRDDLLATSKNLAATPGGGG